jgi:hypothetical protein
MVAYAYAAQYGSEVKKLALMDALLPGIKQFGHRFLPLHEGSDFLHGQHQEIW